MERQEWLDRWAQEFHSLRQQFPTSDMVALQRRANAIMLAQYGPCPDGLGITDKIIRALALRWLRGKLEDLRGGLKETGMGKVLKFLDGWKLVIGVLLMFGAKIWDAYHNGHTGDFVGSVLTTLGWGLPGDWTGSEIALAAGGVVSVWGFIHKLIKAGQQIRAGAKAAEVLSAEGYAKTLPPQPPAPPVAEGAKGIGQPPPQA